MSRFLKVRHIEHADVLGTHPTTCHSLNKGDVVKVRWPDKRITEHEVEICANFVDCGLMGDYTDIVASVYIKHNGMKLKIPLLGLTAALVKRKQTPAPKVVPRWHPTP